MKGKEGVKDAVHALKVVQAVLRRGVPVGVLVVMVGPEKASRVVVIHDSLDWGRVRVELLAHGVEALKEHTTGHGGKKGELN